MHNSISRSTNILFHLVFIVLTLACLVPLLLIAMISITDEKSIASHGYRLIPNQFSFEAYRVIEQMGSGIVNAYMVTIFVTVTGTLLSVMVAALYAYPLSRKDLKLRGWFAFILFFTMLFGGGMVSWYIVCTQYLDLKNSIWALILPSVMNSFFVIILRTFFQTTIPPELIESAKIDGSGEWRTFFQIIIPLSLPGLATIAIFSSVGYWNDYYLSLMFIDDPKLYNLQYLIWRVLSNLQYLQQNLNLNISQSAAGIPQEGARMALAIITIGPIILTYPFFQKYFIKGLTIGSIKG
ncbi:sugar ABC transporter permease [Paenibacillus swuensis]|uniref:Sugar ABC transporter permease n=1 Tax=Paenibacillus swuensis TaxID=1178515 RepID=A0A172THD5_9BACL|nr:carbohydrate ABC transporter permease [Paenibacillus swuensis]ANE46430.1 sugar ABC transporter permease [Paenibacillus swuensis]